MAKLDKIILCVVGKSGSGKTTIVDKLSKLLGYSTLCSYTTRRKRHKDDADHIYVDMETYENLTEKIAETCFNGNYYCATKDQVDNNDLYVIDPAGLDTIKERYHGEKKIISVYIDVPMKECLRRMRLRGDLEDQCWERLRHDEKAFRDFAQEADYVVNGMEANTWQQVAALIENLKGEQ